MAVVIEALGVSVKGQVVRRHEDNRTTLTLTQEQAQEMYDGLGPVLEFFKSQNGSAAT